MTANNGLTIDSDLVSQAYQQMLTESQHQCALYKAAATQLQGRVDQLTQENGELRAQNTQLMQDSGRQDGVPQEPAEAAPTE